MEKKEGKVTNLWGRQFTIVKNGLDEGEVFSFLGNLIEQNSEYVVRLENLESLKRLAESTVMEANKQAQQTLTEIEQQANETATAIISDAEAKAKTEADSVITEAQKKAKLDAETVLAEAEKTSQDKVSTAEQRSQGILERARTEAKKTKAVAEQEAEKIISKATQEAEESARVAADAAEEQRQNVLRKAEEEAEKEVLAAKQEAARLLARSKKMAESEIKQTFGRIYEEMLSTLRLEERAQAMDMSIAETTGPEPAQAEGAATVGADWTDEDLQQKPHGEQEEHDSESELETRARAQEEVAGEEPQGTQAASERPGEGSEEGSHPLYEGTVELQVAAPVVFDRMMQLHKDLKQIPEIEEVNLTRPTAKGLRIELRLTSPIPLLKILGDLPEVAKVSDGPPENKVANPLRAVWARPNRSTIVLTTKD